MMVSAFCFHASMLVAPVCYAAVMLIVHIYAISSEICFCCLPVCFNYVLCVALKFTQYTCIIIIVLLDWLHTKLLDLK